jgi:hypothetical protein
MCVLQVAIIAALANACYKLRHRQFTHCKKEKKLEGIWCKVMNMKDYPLIWQNIISFSYILEELKIALNLNMRPKPFLKNLKTCTMYMCNEKFVFLFSRCNSLLKEWNGVLQHFISKTSEFYL